MIINYQNLINLPVITESGLILGKVCKVDIDTDSQTVVNYYIKSVNLVKGLFEGELIIKKNQIIAITCDKIIVEDNVKKKEAEKNLSLFKTASIKSQNN